MARELAWQFDTNRPSGGGSIPKDVHGYFWWYMLKFLTGRIGGATQGLWTCVASCDGVTAQAGDVFADTFDTAKWVRATSGARTWYVLRAPTPDGTYDLFIKVDYASSNANGLLMNVQHGTGISGGYTTPGTPPTITTLYHNNADFTMHDGTATTFKVHGCLEVTGEFYVLLSKDGSGKFLSGMTMRKVASRVANDPYPWIGKPAYSTTDIFNRNVDGSGGLHGNSHSYASPGFGGRRQDGTVQSHAVLWPAYVQTGNGGGGIYPHDVGTGGVNDILPDGTYLLWPTMVCGANFSNAWFKGRVPDMYLVHANRSDGDRFPMNGAVDYVVAGMCAIPFDQVPSL